MPAPKHLLIYVTCSTREEAEKISNEAVKSKLAACANIGSEITSIYEWNGKLENSKEIQLFLKTTSNNYAELERLIKKSHSYETPCIISLAIDAGYPPFLKWLENSVK